MKTRKQPPFQNIDLMQPKSFREKQAKVDRPGKHLLPSEPTEGRLTAQVPPAIDRIVGTEGCYLNHHEAEW